MIYTSSFHVAARHPKAVAICRGLQHHEGIKTYNPLRPSWEMLRLKGPEFDRAYWKLLAALDPHTVAKEVGDGSVMLCWEHSPLRCHRSAVALWLREAGYLVEELGTRV